VITAGSGDHVLKTVSSTQAELRLNRKPKLVSLVIEVSAIGLLVLAPRLYTEGLPKQLIVGVLSCPSPAVGKAFAQAVREQPRTVREKTELDDNVLREPSRIP
jgi:hypothetical protein